MRAIGKHPVDRKRLKVSERVRMKRRKICWRRENKIGSLVNVWIFALARKAVSLCDTKVKDLSDVK